MYFVDQLIIAFSPYVKVDAFQKIFANILTRNILQDKLKYMKLSRKFLLGIKV